MPVTSAAIGLQSAPFRHRVDARWTMAYGAALGDCDAIYSDTTRPAGVVAHPLFAICPEWPVALASRDQLLEAGLTQEEVRRGVHATHDCEVHRLIRPGDELSTQATIVHVEARRPGAYVLTCFDTHDRDDTLVARTYAGMVYRGVEVVSEAAGHASYAITPTPHAAPLPNTRAEAVEVPIAANLAHVYTECARIFNPIHTDASVAQAAGLPAIILHGSATLALAVSAIVRRNANGDPHRVRRIAAHFRGMVFLPSTLRLDLFPGHERCPDVIPFEVRNDRGEAIVSRGSVSIAPGQG